jgi:hypothetical protein
VEYNIGQIGYYLNIRGYDSLNDGETYSKYMHEGLTVRLVFPPFEPSGKTIWLTDIHGDQLHVHSVRLPYSEHNRLHSLYEDADGNVIYEFFLEKAVTITVFAVETL